MIVSCEVPVVITVAGDDFHLDSKKSSVLALIVNELLQNSIKHAFQGRDHGKIEINSTSNGNIKVIELKDNGVGYDEDLTLKDSLGMMIVKTYVKEKLAGKLIIKSGTEGTTTSFAFKL